MTTPQAGNSFSLGNAVGYVDINTAGATSALNSLSSTIRNAFQGASSAFSNLGSQVTSFGTNLSIAMLPVAGTFNSGVGAAATFQDALAEIQARAGLTDEAMEQVRATALQLGADTAFSAQEAADAMLMLLTAGLDTEQALATLPHVLTGAAAAGADLGQTANQVTNIMSSFQLEAAEAARIVEVMNQAAGASPAEMAQMGEALAMVGGDARNFGLSLEQTGAILTVFARNGKVGAEAGTQLRSILTAMTADTEDSRRAWDMVNSSLFDASGEARDFGVVLAEIDAGLQDLSAEDQAFVIQSLAGSYGRVGLNALLASEGIESVIGEMEQQASAADVAQARLDTFNGRMDALKGSLETLMITGFTPFIESMTPIVEGVTGVINSIAKWVEANQAIVQPILRMLAALILLGPTLIGVGQAFKLVGFLIGSVMSPINLLLIGITLLSAAWTANFMGIRDKLASVFDGIRHLFTIFVSDIGQFGLQEAIAGIFGQGTIADTMESSLEGALTMMGVGRDTAIKIVNSIWKAIRPFVNMATRLFTAFGTAFNNFRLNLQSGLSVFRSLDFAIQTFFGSLGVGAPIISAVRSAVYDFLGLMGQVWDFIQPVVMMFGEWIIAVFGANAALSAMGAVATTVLTTLVSVFAPVGAAIAGVLATIISPLGIAIGLIVLLANAYYKNFGGIRDFIDGEVAPRLMSFFNWLTSGIQNAINGLMGLWNAFQSGGLAGAGTFIQDNLITPLVNSIQTTDWGAIATSVMDAIGTAFTTIVSWATWVYDNLLLPMFNNVKTAIQTVNWGEVATNIIGAIGTAFTTVISWATWIYDNLLSPLVGNVAAAVATIDWMQVGTTLLGAIGTALSLYADYVNWIYTNILSPIVMFAGEAIASIDWYGVGSGIVNAIGTAITTVFDFIAWIVNSIFNPVTTNAEGAAGQIDWGMVGNAILNGIGMFLSGVFNFVTWLYENILSPMVLGAADAIAQTDWSAVGTNLMNAIKNALPNIAQWVLTNIITPITNALGNFNPMNLIGGGSNPTTTTQAGHGVTPSGGVYASGGSGASAQPTGSLQTMSPYGSMAVRPGATIQGFASGLNLVPEDMLALIHAGEAIVPREYNPAAGGAGGGASLNFNGANFYFNANSETEGRAAARGFQSELMELMRSS